MVARVLELQRRHPARFERLMSRQKAASESAADAACAGSKHQLVQALREQRAALEALGDAAAAPIVPKPVAELAVLGEEESAAVLPAGAGGGDVVLFVGLAPPSSSLHARALEHGWHPLELSLGARGVHAWSDSDV
jgi:mevalonate kinase